MVLVELCSEKWFHAKKSIYCLTKAASHLRWLCRDALSAAMRSAINQNFYESNILDDYGARHGTSEAPKSSIPLPIPFIVLKNHQEKPGRIRKEKSYYFPWNIIFLTIWAADGLPIWLIFFLIRKKILPINLLDIIRDLLCFLAGRFKIQNTHFSKVEIA